MSGDAAASAWRQCLDHLADAGDRLADALRERGEPEADIDASLAMLGGLMFGLFSMLWADPDHPTFLPGAGYHQHVGTPNPDTVYRSAAIDGAGTYRLSGDRGTAPDVTFMPFGRPGATGQQSYAPFDLDGVPIGPDGRFEVVMAPERPSGYGGAWWQSHAEMTSLMLRSVSTEWGAHREPAVAIVRLDRPTRRGRPTSDQLDAKVAALGRTVERFIFYGLRHADDLLAAGVVNDVTLVDYSANGGLAKQWYHEGFFDLAGDRALLVEADVPRDCASFSLSLTDRLFCTVDWTHAQSSLNNGQVVIGDDGRLVFAVSAVDPGLANWLDTSGYRRGVLQFRWWGSAEPPIVAVSVVPVASILDRVPASTPTVIPGQRVEALRRRAETAQLRSFW